MGEVPPFDKLTPAEREVLRACFGRTNVEAARELDRGVGTVANHMFSARTKLGGVGRTKATLMFYEYEHRQLSPRRSLPISFPEPGLSDADVGIPPTGTDRVAEERAQFETAPRIAVTEVLEALKLDRRLTRVTLLIAAIALLFWVLSNVKGPTPFFNGMANFVLRYVWY